jgi:hypothetical protein
MNKLPIGVSDFKEIIDSKLYFVDKTLFIKDIIDDSSKVLLITRPRRFGKTLNMSMVGYYFEKNGEDRSYLFKNRKISYENEYYQNEMGKYPVISITFKDVKQNNWTTNLELIMDAIFNEYARHNYLLKSNKLDDTEKARFKSIYNAEYKNTKESDYIKSLLTLSQLLYKHHNEKVIILFDEYDTLLNEAYIHGYWEEAILFLKSFMSAGFKDNIYLKKGVITGIFRVAKESIFSDLNNLAVHTLLSDRYREYFGFTHDEVKDMLKCFNVESSIDDVAEWYNGYRFGKENFSVIYNPWSILNYLEKGIIEPYWVNTSGNAIIKNIIINGSKELKYKIQDIIETKVLNKVRIDENIIYSQIEKSEDSIWSFMLFAGYLKSSKVVIVKGKIYCDLNIANEEVRQFFRDTFAIWIDEKAPYGKASIMLNSLLTGDMETFEELFCETVEKTFGANDVGDNTSENFYHAFVLGMIVYLDEEYEIRSNRESGFGRYDVMLVPNDKTKKGIIIEFKKVNKRRNESLDKALESALAQIVEKKYEVDLINCGIIDILRIGIVFKGKDVKMGIV